MAVPEGTIVPEQIVGYVSVSPGDGGRSVLQYDELSDLDVFRATPDKRAHARVVLERRGFSIMAESDFGFAVVGSPRQWSGLGAADLVTFEERQYMRAGRITSVTNIGFKGRIRPNAARIPGSELRKLFDAVVIERPRAAQGVFPTPVPPPVDRFHLRVPDDVATILNATAAHRRGHRGQGVRVVMVDTGLSQHPFFQQHGYNVDEAHTVIPGSDPYRDPHGHGTGEAANVFAVAPDATLVPVRAATDRGDFIGGLAGFVLAKTLEPSVITNSWGGDYPAWPKLPPLPHPADRILELEIRDAIAQGFVVVFAAGNGTFGMEAQVPGVIAAGGAYSDAGLQLQATPYASGYESPWFGGVTVPTVCGLVGLPPRASYIMLPVPAGSRLDLERAVAGRGDPADGTEPYDGWALFSGTSAAAPQIAGAAAVLRQIDPNQSPQDIAELLRKTAKDVRSGRCHPRFNHEAQENWDLATGDGLIDVSAAAAKLAPLPVQPLAEHLTQGPQPLMDALSDDKVFRKYLTLLSTNDKFRDALEQDPEAAFKKFMKLEIEIDEPVLLAPKIESQAALKAIEDGEIPETFDTTVRLTFMLS
jgi:subtilisin family serine protease